MLLIILLIYRYFCNCIYFLNNFKYNKIQARVVLVCNLEIKEHLIC